MSLGGGEFRKEPKKCHVLFQPKEVLLKLTGHLGKSSLKSRGFFSLCLDLLQLDEHRLVQLLNHRRSRPLAFDLGLVLLLFFVVWKNYLSLV